MAEAMGCELVYAVVPAEGSLEDMAETLERERRKQQREGGKSLAGKDPYGFLKTLDTAITLARWHTGKS
jgi:hypothetical protein